MNNIFNDYFLLVFILKYYAGKVTMIEISLIIVYHVDGRIMG
jgi:hypothetical protein